MMKNKRAKRWAFNRSEGQAGSVSPFGLTGFVAGCLSVSLMGLALVPNLPADADFSPYTQQMDGSDAGIEMVPLEGGTFTMGTDPDEPFHREGESPSIEVEVSPFWIGKYEITWDQYETFMFSEELEPAGDLFDETDAQAITGPSRTYVDPSYGMERGENPAVSMTQFAALAFTRWLTLKTGDFYRLPTEAEWEYACRAGTTTAYPFGDDPSGLDRFAWYRGNSGDQYHEVGSKEPNRLGLYDMIGNAAEWTMDQYKEDFYSILTGQPVHDPWAKPTSLEPRTVRGGSWNDDPELLRCAARIPSDPERWKRNDPQIPRSLWWNTNSPFVGFRVVRPLEQPSKQEMDDFWETTLDQFYYE